LHCANLNNKINYTMSKQHTKKIKPFSDVIGLLLFIVLLPLIIVVIALYLLGGLLLYVTIWCRWCLFNGRYVLFVYSDSPIWHDYIEEHVLPRLRDYAVVLNWSQRKQWRQTLAVLAFRYFGGYQAFNPMAVVFRPLRLARRFRFYEPFHEFKHGKTEALTQMEKEFYDLVDRITGQ
jgi:hypothetical protein